MNLSPWPYCPGAVLKKRYNCRAWTSSPIAIRHSNISLAFSVIDLRLMNDRQCCKLFGKTHQTINIARLYKRNSLLDFFERPVPPFDGFKLFNYLVRKTFTQGLCGDASHDCIRLDILGYHGSCANNRPVANMNSGHDYCILSTHRCR